MAIRTLQEFGAAVLEGVNVDIDDLPKGSMVAWFADPVSNRATIFRHQQPLPFDRHLVVIAIFQDTETIRVYALPAAPPDPKPADWKDAVPSRFTLTRSAPTYVAEVMNLDAMAALLIDEWDSLGSSGGADEELASVTDWLRSKGHETLADQLEAGDHHEEDDGPEGNEHPTDPPPPGLGATPPATPPTVTS